MGASVSSSANPSSADPSWAELRSSLKDIRSMGTYWEDDLREMNDPNHKPREPPDYPPGFEEDMKDTHTVSLKIWKRFDNDPKLLWKLLDLMVNAPLSGRNEPKHEELLKLLAPAPDLAEEFKQMLARTQDYFDKVGVWQKEHAETLGSKGSAITRKMS